MIKKLVFTLLAAATFTFTSHAQRIAVVDINEILANFPDYQNAEKMLDKTANEWRQEVSQEMDKVKALYNKYQAEQVLLSPEQKKEKEEEIVKREAEVMEMQRKRFGPEGDLFIKRQELVAPIQDKVYNAIEEFAAAKGFDIIFDKAGSAGLLFATDEFDKTEDVKRKLGIK